MAMTFNEKLTCCISKLMDIDKPDYPMNEANYYVDFIELLALFSGKDGIAYGDINDRFFGEPDENNSSEQNDINESFIDGLFLLIEERIVQYGDLYPFMIVNEYTFVLKDEISYNQKIYLFLLLSSSLDIFKSFISELTSDFESLSHNAIQHFLPKAIIKSFGKNSEYTGTAIEKIKKLAEDIGLPIKDSNFNCIGSRNVQERGLDVVGWLPFTDNCYNKMVFLCQCACGKNYEYKQHETRRFRSYYDFYKTRPQHTLFIPYSLINPKNGYFYHSDYIEEDCLLFERLRILYLTKDTDIFNQLQSKKIVEKCIEYCNMQTT